MKYVGSILFGLLIALATNDIGYPLWVTISLGVGSAVAFAVALRGGFDSQYL